MGEVLCPVSLLRVVDLVDAIAMGVSGKHSKSLKEGVQDLYWENFVGHRSA